MNVLAPYVLASEIELPVRVIRSSSSGLHRRGDQSLYDIDWTSRRCSAEQAYSDSKLFVATLAFLAASRWPDVRRNVVDPC